MRGRGIDTVIISGGSTDVGVISTVLFGRDMDFSMIVVREACATSHQECTHEVLVDLIFPWMARVRTKDQVLGIIEQANKGA